MTAAYLTGPEIVAVIEEMAEDSGEISLLVLLAILAIMSPSTIRRASHAAMLSRVPLSQLLAEVERRGTGDA